MLLKGKCQKGEERKNERNKYSLDFGMRFPWGILARKFKKTDCLDHLHLDEWTM
jgi:hypothetical protein